MIVSKIAKSKNDEFYTPSYAVEPIMKYVKPGSTIWCPFDTEDSLFVKNFVNAGYNVIHSHISDGCDFFEMTLPKCDYII